MSTDGRVFGAVALALWSSVPLVFILSLDFLTRNLGKYLILNLFQAFGAPHTLADDMESDQSILDDHCSRVFDNSPEHTIKSSKSKAKSSSSKHQNPTQGHQKGYSSSWGDRRQAGFGTMGHASSYSRGHMGYQGSSGDLMGYSGGAAGGAHGYTANNSFSDFNTGYNGFR